MSDDDLSEVVDLDQDSGDSLDEVIAETLDVETEEDRAFIQPDDEDPEMETDAEVDALEEDEDEAEETDYSDSDDDDDEGDDDPDWVEDPELNQLRLRCADLEVENRELLRDLDALRVTVRQLHQYLRAVQQHLPAHLQA